MKKNKKISYNQYTIEQITNEIEKSRGDVSKLSFKNEPAIYIKFDENKTIIYTIIYNEMVTDYFYTQRNMFPTHNYAIVLTKVGWGQEEQIKYQLNKDDIELHTIRRNLQCRGWIFVNSVRFSIGKFYNKVNFSEAIFFDKAIFGGAIFKKQVNFTRALFKQEAYFNGVKFDNDCNFSEAKFCRAGNFHETKFKNLAQFHNVNFQQAVTFKNAYFNGIADFSINTFFKMPVDFTYVKFDSVANFKKTTFENICDWSNCIFNMSCDFTQIKVGKKTKLKFQNTIFNENVEFSFANIDGKILFDNTSFRQKCSFPLEFINEDKVSPFIINSGNIYNDYKIAKNNFKVLKNISKSNDDIENQLEAHYLYKKYEVKADYEKNKNWIRYKFNSLLDLTSKYFTNYIRTLEAMLWIWLGSSIIYFIFNFLYDFLNFKWFGHIAKLNFQWNCCNLFFNIKNLVEYFFNHFYFSLITFTTIGYGDMHPVGLLKIVAGLEGLIGITLSAMFMVTLAKRILG